MQQDTCNKTHERQDIWKIRMKDPWSQKSYDSTHERSIIRKIKYKVKWSLSINEIYRWGEWK